MSGRIPRRVPRVLRDPAFTAHLDRDPVRGIAEQLQAARLAGMRELIAHVSEAWGCPVDEQDRELLNRVDTVAGLKRLAGRILVLRIRVGMGVVTLPMGDETFARLLKGPDEGSRD